MIREQIQSHALTIRRAHADSPARIDGWLKEVGADISCPSASASIIGGMK